jgi:predicted site-specific integrase-resolvase
MLYNGADMLEMGLIPGKDVPGTAKISQMTSYRWIAEGRFSVVKLSTGKVYVRREEPGRFIKDSEK